MTEIMLYASSVRFFRGLNRSRDVLVVVGDVASQCGETDVGRKWECETMDSEALGPLVPWMAVRMSMQHAETNTRVTDTHKPCTVS